MYNWPWSFIEQYFQCSGGCENVGMWYDTLKPRWRGRTSSAYPSCFPGHILPPRKGTSPLQGQAFPGRRSAAHVACKRWCGLDKNIQRASPYYRHAYAPGRARHDVVQIRFLEAIKGRGGRYGVGPHVLKDQPVANLQVRQAAQLNDAIQAVARRSPDATGIPDLIWLSFLWESGGGWESRWILWETGHLNPPVSFTLCSVGRQCAWS